MANVNFTVGLKTVYLNLLLVLYLNDKKDIQKKIKSLKIKNSQFHIDKLN